MHPERIRCREGCTRFPIKIEAGRGSGFTSNLETHLVDHGRDFGGAAVEIGKWVHGVFNEECIGKEKESGVGPRP